VINIQNKSPWRINQWVIDNCRDEKPEAMIQEEWDQFQEDTVELVTLLGTNRKIYLTHRVDKRGRLYCHGYHLNYQGNEYRRAMIDLGIGEKVSGSLL
jgi:DNA-directed RNA polymerase